MTMLCNRPFVVLVAEDDPVCRRLLRHTLGQAGYEVLAAADGEEAWQFLVDREIDMLVTDYQMPRCSGVELLERMHLHSLTAPSLVGHTILCTGKGYEFEHAELQSRFGLLSVMGKPFSPRKLVQCVNDVFVTDLAASKAGRAIVDSIGGQTTAPAGESTWGFWRS